MKHAITAALSILCGEFFSRKEAENLAIAARRETGENICTLPEVKANEKVAGSVTYADSEYTLEIRYCEREKIDFEKFAAAIPNAMFSRCVIMKPEFSKSGYNTLLKQLRSEGLHDPAMRKLADKIEKAYADFRTTEPAATQITVKRNDE